MIIILISTLIVYDMRGARVKASQGQGVIFWEEFRGHLCAFLAARADYLRFAEK
jgi:hypothetical protein